MSYQLGCYAHTTMSNWMMKVHVDTDYDACQSR
jgi:hypothetical protein